MTITLPLMNRAIIRYNTDSLRNPFHTKPKKNSHSPILTLVKSVIIMFPYRVTRECVLPMLSHIIIIIYSFPFHVSSSFVQNFGLTFWQSCDEENERPILRERVKRYKKYEKTRQKKRHRKRFKIFFKTIFFPLHVFWRGERKTQSKTCHTQKHE